MLFRRYSRRQVIPVNSRGDGTIVIETGDAIENPDILATRLVNSGNPPTHLVVEEEDLEQYFLRLVGLNGGEDHA